MYQGELPNKEMDVYMDKFGTFPGLMMVIGNLTKEDLILRMEKAIKENKPIPDDDPIYIEMNDDIII